MKIKHFEVEDLRLKRTKKYVRVIELAPDGLLTRDAVIKYTGSDVERDVLKLVAVESEKGSGDIGLGFVKGVGLTKGAVAQSLSIEPGLIIGVGKSDEDLASAVRRVAQLGGGIVVVAGGMIMAELKLPLAVKRSENAAELAAEKTRVLAESAAGLGCRLAAPFAVLAFLTAAPIPQLRLTEKGLFDPVKQKIVDLFE